jgi:hypothetical protein
MSDINHNASKQENTPGDDPNPSSGSDVVAMVLIFVAYVGGLAGVVISFYHLQKKKPVRLANCAILYGLRFSPVLLAVLLVVSAAASGQDGLERVDEFAGALRFFDRANH